MAQLPPKIPSITPLWPDFIFSGHHHHHQKFPIPPLTAAPVPATNPPPNAAAATQASNNGNNNNPSWVDEFLDFTHARRGAHRRSASDSIAFLDSSLILEGACRLDASAGNNVASTGPGSNADSGSDFERFDDEQFMSMFTDEISPGQVEDNNNGSTAGPGASSSNPSTPSDQSSVNEEKHHSPQPLDDHRQTDQKAVVMMKNEAEEAHSPCESDATAEAGNVAGGPGAATASVTGSSERIVDPKRVKR